MRRTILIFTAGSLVLAACGGSSGGDEGAAEPATAPVTLPRTTEAGEAGQVGPTTSAATPAPTEAAADPVLNLFPDVDVIEIATGETINLLSLIAIDQPVLLWFWAPH
ncbi:MAG: hypothetical protein GY745_09400 [Actinomycetia bacterium]|nr:hypothetical protein [Actinomycetes bacterium]MCP3913610.1 hypothetical protein [Actinomycetes bacterium]MCP4085247.1 hypothetical protein [Actinomycetes bacterium]